MTGTEFEKAAGREKAKKWKASVRVAPTNGNQGEMVGDWLQVHPPDPSICSICVSASAHGLCVYAELSCSRASFLSQARCCLQTTSCCVESMLSVGIVPRLLSQADACFMLSQSLHPCPNP